MSFAALALRNLLRRPLRASLAACGVALAVASFLALNGLARGNARAWEHSFATQGTQVMASRKGGVELLSTSIPEATGTRLAHLDGVAAVAGELLDLVELHPGQNVIVSGRRPDGYLWRSLETIEGRLPNAGSEDEVALGKSIADALALHGGARLDVNGRAMTVTGVVRTDSALMSHMLYMPLPQMQRLLGRAGVVTIFNLRLAPGTDTSRVDALLRTAAAAFPELTFTSTGAILDENPVLQLASALGWAISLVALVMGLVGVVNALLMSVTERIREIGILAAVGWSPGRVIALIVCEGVLLACAGSIVGIAGGYAGLRALASSPRIAGLLEPEFTAQVALEAVLVTLALGALGGLYPAWRATSMPAVEALKHE